MERHLLVLSSEYSSSVAEFRTFPQVEAPSSTTGNRLQMDNRLSRWNATCTGMLPRAATTVAAATGSTGPVFADSTCLNRLKTGEGRGAVVSAGGVYAEKQTMGLKDRMRQTWHLLRTWLCFRTYT